MYTDDVDLCPAFQKKGDNSTYFAIIYIDIPTSYVKKSFAKRKEYAVAIR